VTHNRYTARYGPGVPIGAARMADFAKLQGWSAHISEGATHTEGTVVRLTLVHGPWPSETSMEIQVNYATRNDGIPGYFRRDHVFYRHGRGPWQQMICTVSDTKDLITRHKLPTVKPDPRYQGQSPGSPRSLCDRDDQSEIDRLRTFRGRR
jgi:hypothetical protein